MLVIGGGIIGLEMATVYSTLGTRIDVVEMLDGLMTGADRDLVKVWEKKNAGRFDHAEDQDRVGEGDARRARRRWPSRSSMIWCWWRSAGARMAARSMQKKPALR
jgi:Pyridine nucleotide-disulphide oxidoreductase